MISIHAAREGGDSGLDADKLDGQISIHAAREGGDYYRLLFILNGRLFQSTPPVKAATADYSIVLSLICISIHAAREGGDAQLRSRCCKPRNFNPRRP